MAAPEKASLVQADIGPGRIAATAVNRSKNALASKLGFRAVRTGASSEAPRRFAGRWGGGENWCSGRSSDTSSTVRSGEREACVKAANSQKFCVLL